MLTKIPESSKIELAERIAIMDDPPAMIVSRLILDKNLKVAGLLIEKGSVVSDQDLYTLVDSDDVEKCILIARRRLVSPGVANALVDKNDPNILLALVRNPEASLIEQGAVAEATRLVAQLGRVSESSANRIITDASGEPLTIIFKALGISRAEFADTLARWQASPSAVLRSDRDIEELKTLFDVLSYNKARVVLTYWDWLARKAGALSEDEVPAAI